MATKAQHGTRGQSCPHVPRAHGHSQRIYVVLALVSTAHRADQPQPGFASALRHDQPSRPAPVRFHLLPRPAASYLSGCASALPVRHCSYVVLMSSWRVLGANSASAATQIDEVEATEVTDGQTTDVEATSLRSRQPGGHRPSRRSHLRSRGNGSD